LTLFCKFQLEAQRASPQYGHSAPESLPDSFCPVSIRSADSQFRTMDVCIRYFPDPLGIVLAHQFQFIELLTMIP